MNKNLFSLRSLLLKTEGSMGTEIITNTTLPHYHTQSREKKSLNKYLAILLLIIRYNFSLKTILI